MIVAVSGVNMMQPAIDQIINMITVRHGFVAAIRPVDMATGQRGGAAIGIGGGYRDHMFINMIAVNVVKMAIMQIIGVAIVLNGRVATAGAVDVGMIEMDLAAHCWPFTRSRPDRPATAALPPGNILALGDCSAHGQ
jgi:hypothetical protein